VIDSALKPHATNLNYFYVWSDVGLFCLAMFIVMGFWGGKFSQAWIINALAVFCFYISDIWFAYAANHVENYQSGFFLEIFWTFGAILFGIAAATEFEFMLAQQQKQQDLSSEL
jgi:TRAP-type C4-dicarboxylate transport system permease large subunit